MARGLNKAQLIGNLGQDPELRYTGDGTAVCNLRVATNERGDHTEWHTVTAWEDLAELCNEHLEKGRRVYVEGQLRTRSWEDRDGNERESTEIRADEVIFLGSEGAPSGNQSPDEDEGQSFDQSDPPSGEQDFEPDDELPF
jgi:single-strand DNA-binding protein